MILYKGQCILFSVFLLFKMKVRKRCFNFVSVFWVILSNKWLLLFIKPVHAYKDFNQSVRDFLFIFYSPQGSCVQGVFQAGILGWVSSPGDLSDPGVEPVPPAMSPVLQEADSLLVSHWGSLTKKTINYTVTVRS